MKHIQKSQVVTIQMREAVLRIIRFLWSSSKQDQKMSKLTVTVPLRALPNSLGLTKTFGTESMEEIERISLLHLNLGLNGGYHKQALHQNL